MTSEPGWEGTVGREARTAWPRSHSGSREKQPGINGLRTPEGRDHATA